MSWLQKTLENSLERIQQHRISTSASTSILTQRRASAPNPAFISADAATFPFKPALRGSNENQELGGEDTPTSAWLTIYLWEAKDLIAADRSGTSDPYVVFRAGDTVVRSSIVPKTLNPTWNETFNLLIPHHVNTVEMGVWDKDLVSDDELGYCSVELSSLACSPFARVSSWLQLQKVPHGQLHVSLTLRPLGSGERTADDSPAATLRDGYGFLLSPRALEMKKRRARQNGRLLKEQHSAWMKEKWWKLINKERDSPQIKFLVRKGIPYTLRGEIWQLLCGAKAMRMNNPGEYETLLESYDGHASAAVTQISKDLHRTFPGHRIFDNPDGRESLRRVLIAYAWKNQTVGYCQSMNFIAALLLLYMGEEDAFWVLHAIVDKLIPNYFASDMIGMKADTLIFNKLLSERMKKLFDHMVEIDFSISTICSQWFLSMFINFVPIETVFRIFDAFFSEGVIAFFAATLSILKECEEELLAVQDFDECFSILQHTALNYYDYDSILKVGFGVLGSLSLEKLEELREDAYEVIKEKKKADDLLMLRRVTSFRDTDLQRMMEHFQSMKVSASGSVDFESFQELLGFMDLRDPILLSQLFKQFDDNGDGTIEFREFICGLNVLSSGSFEDKLLLTFRTFDLDGSGYLDKDELGIMFDIQYKMLGATDDFVRVSDQMLDKLLKEIDQDGNGRIDFTEFKMVVHKMPLLSQWLELMSAKMSII
eukprot:TRINITY_DN11782_c0_g1_i1.p1 TRINITY_DN11782_c0_g1~~TRINITY_DN11782_c0_g1_i1.p1  ORF type:complete len:712 (-),score=151.23 TRINITY_DN11782_c0_g1_i1:216-2351(-)